MSIEYILDVRKSKTLDVLIVEHEAVAEMLNEFLKFYCEQNEINCKIRVIKSESYEQLVLEGPNRYDIIFATFGRPGCSKDGIDFYKELMSIGYCGEFVLTANDTSEAKNKVNSGRLAEVRGALFVLKKPTTLNSFGNLMHRCRLYTTNRKIPWLSQVYPDSGYLEN